jgi:hypothetical protein
MAARKANLEDSMTFVMEQEDKSYRGPMVNIYLPKLEEEGSGVQVDQYEHVTIANEEGEKTYYVKRGERVDVPVAVYVVMKEKYPDL